MRWNGGLCVLAGALLLLASQPVHAEETGSNILKRGEYLARAGDCFSCHTKDGGTPMAGGRQLQTPYGTIASPNITPDRDTGIGAWSDDDFYRLVHDGIDRDGHFVYPAMPFDHYTKVTRDDVLAIKSFLFSLQPAHAPRQANHLEFPFNIRSSLAVWRGLSFKAGTFEPDPSKSAAENRGAYLVEGLGHCGACHTPRNLLSASKESEALGGAVIGGQGWFAPNITSDVRQGIGSWSEQQIASYLKSGVADNGAIVAGPMMEVVHTSLQYLTDDDLHAMAAYLKAVPAQTLYSEDHTASPPGANAFLSYCASCHQPDGSGIQGAISPLAGNGTVTAGGPENLVRTILGGMPAMGRYGPMPGFSTVLSDEAIAEIANYARTSWGNTAPASATRALVNELAQRTHTMLAGTGQCDAVGPSPVAEAISRENVEPILRQMDAANMLNGIDSIVAKLRTAASGPAQADFINGVTAAYCPVVMGDQTIPQQERLRQLQRFATLLYSQLESTQEGVQHASQHSGQSTEGN